MVIFREAEDKKLDGIPTSVSEVAFKSKDGVYVSLKDKPSVKKEGSSVSVSSGQSSIKIPASAIKSSEKVGDANFKLVVEGGEIFFNK
jgi:hypothetical protein